ncbi:MAG: helicase-exonuclease AddAB subunit AddB, partial [Firmicutes bacterium]|nr:helicase-exonuclease AddAB subunit AddB [Bacillota bacterium]
MKLRLIEGGAGSGKSYLCLQELAARQKAEPLGKPLLLLVPEQATFAGERAYVNFAEGGDEPVGASLRVQAVSFSGLYRLLAAEQTFAALPWLDEQGRAMLLEACLQQNRGQLEILDAAAGNISFVDALARALVEFEQYA